MKRLSMIALLLAACATMQSGDAERFIRGAATDFANAANHGNVDALVAMYANDAVLMPPNAPAFWTLSFRA